MTFAEKFEELKQNEFDAKYAYEDDGSLIMGARAKRASTNGVRGFCQRFLGLLACALAAIPSTLPQLIS